MKSVKKVNKSMLCSAMAQSMREFGYPDVTDAMAEECWDAYARGDEKLPYGVVGMFLMSQLDDVAEARPDLLKRGVAE